jgi:hypothetical protein
MPGGYTARYQLHLQQDRLEGELCSRVEELRGCNGETGSKRRNRMADGTRCTNAIHADKPPIGDGAREIRETHEKGGVYGNGCTYPMGERVILLKEFISRLFALFAGNPITFLG